MKGFLLVIPFFVLGVGMAYGEPLEYINSTLTTNEDSSSSVTLSWNKDSSVAKYEAGCVSCLPNIAELTSEENIILKDVTPISITSTAILYVIAYDYQNEIIRAKQVFVEFK